MLYDELEVVDDHLQLATKLLASWSLNKLDGLCPGVGANSSNCQESVPLTFRVTKRNEVDVGGFYEAAADLVTESSSLPLIRVVWKVLLITGAGAEDGSPLEERSHLGHELCCRKFDPARFRIGDDEDGGTEVESSRQQFEHLLLELGKLLFYLLWDLRCGKGYGSGEEGAAGEEGVIPIKDDCCLFQEKLGLAGFCESFGGSWRRFMD